MAKARPVIKMHSATPKDEVIGEAIGAGGCVHGSSSVEHSRTPDDGPGFFNALGIVCISNDSGITCKCYAGFTLMSAGLGVICTYEDL